VVSGPPWGDLDLTSCERLKSLEFLRGKALSNDFEIRKHLEGVLDVERHPCLRKLEELRLHGLDQNCWLEPDTFAFIMARVYKFSGLKALHLPQAAHAVGMDNNLLLLTHLEQLKVHGPMYSNGELNLKLPHGISTLPIVDWNETLRSFITKECEATSILPLECLSMISPELGGLREIHPKRMTGPTRSPTLQERAYRVN
jgi:hypothetical protein